MSKPGELTALTSVRGIAAWTVVAYHLRLAPAGLPQPVVDILAKGYLAVDFFFLLSGFVIWLAWQDRLRRDRIGAIAPFLRRRIARIWPLHLVMLGFAVALASALAMTGRVEPAEFPLHELPLHILLVQNWGFTAALSWNDPAWSISCEFAAYLLFPALVFAIDWRRVPSPVVLAAIAALFALLYGVYAAAGAAWLHQAVTRLGILRCVLEFAAGGALAALWLRWRERPVLAVPAALFGVVLLMSGLPEVLAVPAGFAALLLALALTSPLPGNPLAARWLHALGEASYATYLSHYMLWVAFKLAFVADPNAVPWAVMAAYLLLVLAASFGLYRWVELPAQRWINDLGHRPSPARSAAPQ